MPKNSLNFQPTHLDRQVRFFSFMLNNQNIKKFTFNFIEIFLGILKNLGWKLVVGLGLAIGALLFFGWLASEIVEGETRVFDDSIRNFCQSIASPTLTNIG